MSRYSIHSTPIGTDYQMVSILNSKNEVLLKGAIPNKEAENIVAILKKETDKNNNQIKN